MLSPQATQDPADPPPHPTRSSPAAQLPQTEHSCEPLVGLNVPEAQETHDPALAPPHPTRSSPTPHSPHSKQLSEANSSPSGLKEPSPQATQDPADPPPHPTRSSPAPHSPHVEHTPAPFFDLKKPSSQGTHSPSDLPPHPTRSSPIPHSPHASHFKSQSLGKSPGVGLAAAVDLKNPSSQATHSPSEDPPQPSRYNPLPHPKQASHS